MEFDFSKATDLQIWQEFFKRFFGIFYQESTPKSDEKTLPHSQVEVTDYNDITMRFKAIFNDNGESTGCVQLMDIYTFNKKTALKAIARITNYFFQDY